MMAKSTSNAARRRTGRPREGLSQALSDPDLSVEIAMLRKAIRKVSEMSEAEAPDLSTRLEALATIGMAINRLASLLKTQKFLVGDQDKAANEAISTALQEIMEELNIK